VKLAKGARVALLGTRHDDVTWHQKGGDVVISVPVLDDGEVPFDGAWTFRIEGLPGS
jgi:hypothetical protein